MIQIFLKFAYQRKHSLGDPKPYRKDEKKKFLTNKTMPGLGNIRRRWQKIPIEFFGKLPTFYWHFCNICFSAKMFFDGIWIIHKKRKIYFWPILLCRTLSKITTHDTLSSTIFLSNSPIFYLIAPKTLDILSEKKGNPK